MKFDPATLHVKRRKVQHILRTTLGTHILSLFRTIQIAVTNSKLRIMGDGVEPTLSYVKRNDTANPFHVFPRRLRISFLSFFPVLIAQSSEALNVFLSFLRRWKPRTILEIGTAYGGTLLMFTKVAADDALIITLDVDRPEWRKKMYAGFARRQQVILSIKADSHDPRTAESLAWAKFDLLFIDGDHSYEGVKKDFLMYKKLVTRGGIIAFHDVHLNGVQKLWNEIKDSYDHSEIQGTLFLTGKTETGIIYV